MARSQATLSSGVRLSDYLSVGVIAQVFPLSTVRAALDESGRRSQRQRSLPAEVMVYYVIAMALFRSVSAREVLRCLADGLRLMTTCMSVRVAGKSSISRARTRLGTAPLAALCRACVGVVATPETRGAWYRGRRLVAFDGSTLDVADERTNRAAFGLPGGGRGQAAFPQVRLTAMVELGTRVAFAWHRGPLRESEAEQAEALLRHLRGGMLVLADRGYFGFPLWLRATQSGADLLWRVPTRNHLPVLERLADGSFRSIVRGSGQDRRRSRGACPLRVVEYRIKGVGNRVFRLATTLLDPQQAPATELAALYHERWESENVYDEVKTHLLGRGAVLRSKTPNLVCQEVDGLMLAYYAVRCLIHAAARHADEDPDRLSFVHAVQVVRRRVQNAGAFPPGASG